MKYVKMLALSTFATAALVAFTGAASATITSPNGTLYTGDVHSTSANTTLHWVFGTTTCTNTTKTVTVSNGRTRGPVVTYDVGGCGTEGSSNDTIAVIKGGEEEINSEGKVISTGLEFTIQVHRTIFGFPVTTHCIFATNNTLIGTLTQGEKPEIHAASAPIPQKATDGGCGSESLIMTGSYTVNTPKPIFIP